MDKFKRTSSLAVSTRVCSASLAATRCKTEEAYTGIIIKYWFFKYSRNRFEMWNKYIKISCWTDLFWCTVVIQTMYVFNFTSKLMDPKSFLKMLAEFFLRSLFYDLGVHNRIMYSEIYVCWCGDTCTVLSRKWKHKQKTGLRCTTEMVIMIWFCCGSIFKCMSECARTSTSWFSTHFKAFSSSDECQFHHLSICVNGHHAKPKWTCKQCSSTVNHNMQLCNLLTTVNSYLGALVQWRSPIQNS